MRVNLSKREAYQHWRTETLTTKQRDALRTALNLRADLLEQASSQAHNLYRRGAYLWASGTLRHLAEKLERGDAVPQSTLEKVLPEEPVPKLG